MRFPLIATWLGCALIWSIPLVASGQASDWKQVAQKDGVIVLTRTHPGSDVAEVRAQGIIDAPPERVLAALTDFEAYTETMPYTAESRVMKREGDAVWLYQVIDAPLSSRRDLCMKISVVRAKGRVGTRWTLANDVAPAPREGIVRVPASEGGWELAPIRGGKATRAIYRIHTDPGGSVPRWVINQANKTAVPDAFLAVRKAATSKRYAEVEASPKPEAL